MALVLSVPENGEIEIRDREDNVCRIKLCRFRVCHPNKRVDVVFTDDERNFRFELWKPAAAIVTGNPPGESV